MIPKLSATIKVNKEHKYPINKEGLTEIHLRRNNTKKTIEKKLKAEHYKFYYDNTSIDDAIDRLDGVFLDSMNKLKKRFTSDFFVVLVLVVD